MVNRSLSLHHLYSQDQLDAKDPLEYQVPQGLLDPRGPQAGSQVGEAILV